LKEWEFDPQVEKLIVKTLSDLVKKGLVGQTISDKVGSVTVTSEVIYCLWEEGEHSIAESAIEQVFQRQYKSGETAGAFPGMGLKQPSIWATINALLYLLKTEPSLISDQRIQMCIGWLASVQKDGGWGLVTASGSKCFYTAHGLLAMLQAYQSLESAKKSGSITELRTLKELEPVIIKSIKRAKRYLLKRRIGNLNLWGVDESATDFCPYTTLSTLLALKKYGEILVGEVVGKEDVDRVYFDYIKPKLFSFNNFEFGEAWCEITETIPVFSIYFHPPTSLFMLLEIGIDPLDDLCLEMFRWLKNNHIKEGNQYGWRGTPNNSPDKILLWSTALGIISLLQMRKVLNSKSKDELLNYVFAEPTPEKINSSIYQERSKKYANKEMAFGQTKKKLLILAAVLASLLLMTNLDHIWTGCLWIVSNWATPLGIVVTVISVVLSFLGAVASVLEICQYLRNRKPRREKNRLPPVNSA
jgi:hypothetical protein